MTIHQGDKTSLYVYALINWASKYMGQKRVGLKEEMSKSTIDFEISTFLFQ